MEFEKISFAYEKKGYSPAEVDEYIAHLFGMYSNLERDYAELERKYRALQIKMGETKSDESAVTGIIVSAQKMADSIVADAEKKAEAISVALNESCNEILDSYAKRAAAERDKLARVENAVANFKESLYNAYREHLGAIERIMPDEAEDEEKMSEATEDQLVNEALELTKKKYEENSDNDVEYISRQNSSEDTSSSIE